MDKEETSQKLVIEHDDIPNKKEISKDRICDYKKRYKPNVTIPSTHILDEVVTRDQIKEIIDYRVILEHFYNEGRLSLKQIEEIIKASSKILSNEPNLLEIEKSDETNVYIIGDIHGQYYDFVNILKNYNLRKDTLVFLGDYVDRGKFSFEVYFLLLTIKICYPKNVFLLRGNHETLRMTRYFTFREECIHKYNEDVYKMCCDSFRCLPLAAVVNKSFFCAHGGISPSIDKVEIINSFNRNTEPPLSGIMCDVLWSDPHPDYNNASSKYGDYLINTQRNCSYFFTSKAVKKFLEANDLKCVIRGHEVQLEGFKIYKSTGNNKGLSSKNKKADCDNDISPSVITIFSAPNYCDAYNNYGAVIKVNGSKINIKKFTSVSHPFYLPNFLDGINWSFPFIGEKMSEFFMDLLMHLESQESIGSTSSIETTLVEDSQSTATRNVEEEIENARILAGAMTIMRTERECINELEDEESTELPCCSLKIIENEELSFEEAKDKDIVNEKIKSKDNIFQGSSVSNPPSVAPEISKALEKVDLKELIKDAEINVHQSKKVLDVRIKNGKTPKKNSLCCWFSKN